MKRKLKKLLVLSAMAWVFSTCTVLSFYPLYTDEVLIRDDKIIGTWYTLESSGLFGDEPEDTLIWDISFQDEIWEKKLNNPFDRGSSTIPNTFAYTLLMYDKAKPDTRAEFLIHLVKLGDQVFVDFFPEEWGEGISNTVLAMHLMGVHTFARIDIGDQVTINWFDSERLENLLKENRIRIKHENNGAYMLLTAKPEELQKFVLKYANEEDAFSEGLLYTLNRN